MSQSQSQSIVLSNNNRGDIEADERRHEPATWRTLPCKGQLSILGLCRLVDFLQISSLQAYLFYQVKSFNADLDNAEVSWQVGFLQGIFTAAQCFTAILWGRAADASWCGRKTVLLISLLGTALSCFGLGFSTSFAQAVIFRTIGGSLNGAVGIIRTMISENVKEKKFQSRAFLILPMSFNLAALIGPVLGGFLADTTRTSSKTSQVASKSSNEVGYSWSFPYALPNVVNGILLLLAALAVYLGTEETLESRKYRFDTGLDLGRRLISTISLFQSPGRRNEILPRKTEETECLTGCSHISSDYSVESAELGDSHERKSPVRQVKEPDMRLRFRHIWTPNFLSVLVAEALFDFHLGAFSSLLPLFLSTPALERKPQSQLGTMNALPYAITGGLGMPVTSVGMALALLGVVGLTLQVTLFPVIHAKLEVVQSFRLFSALFPLGYVAMPILSFLSSSVSLWTGIISILSILATARTFTLPAVIVLLNNSSPHPSVLGTVHAIGQSVSVLFRTVGSTVGGSWYGIGLQNGSGSEAWWNVSAVAVLGFLASWLIVEGSGHEIMLPGEGPIRTRGQ